MKKIVINKCYGGFGLSDKGMRRYAEIKGLTLYPEIRKHTCTIYWIVPPNERSDQPSEKQAIYHWDIARDDPALVQVVEELGNEANGECAELSVVEIPNDIDWHIHDYDGFEHVAEDHATWG